MIMVAQTISTGQAKETAFKGNNNNNNNIQNLALRGHFGDLSVAREFAKLHLTDSRYYQTAAFGNSHYIL
jgi:hypothetical protein